MPELVRVADDAHGLDAAVDDVDREHAPDLDLSLRRSCATAGVRGVLPERGELARIDVARLQAPQRLCGREPLRLAERRLGRAPHEAAGLAVDPDPPALERT